MITVLVAHSQKLMSQALATSLSLQPDFRVVSWPNGTEGFRAAINRLDPDAILVDPVFYMKVGRLQSSEGFPERGRVILFSANDPALDSPDSQPALCRLGPDSPLGELIELIRTAGGQHGPGSLSDLSKLTPRESEILGLVAAGLSNRQISTKLSVTERTVKYHVSNILKKLRLGSRTEAAVAFVQRG